MKAIYTALAAFQQEMPAIKKNASGYGYKFADLDEITKSIKPLMLKYKLGFTQPIDGTKLKTILFHTESGESIEGCAEIPQGVTLKGQNEFQTMGSAITYLRRYGLVSILGLVTDEDADAAGETKRREPAPSRNVVAENAKYMNMKPSDVAKEFPDIEREYAENEPTPEPPTKLQIQRIKSMMKGLGFDDGKIAEGLMKIETAEDAERALTSLKKRGGEHGNK